MIAFFRKNFMLSNIVVRILFVLTYFFSHWQTGLTSTLIVMGETNWPLAILVLVIIGTVLMFLIPVITGVLLGWARIISVPRAEFCFLAYVFCAVGFAILGIFNLVNLFTPLLLSWGEALFPLIAAAVASLLFYRVTSKLYFNDVTRPHYFKMCAVYFAVFAVIIEVL